MLVVLGQGWARKPPSFRKVHPEAPSVVRPLSPASGLAKLEVPQVRTRTHPVWSRRRPSEWAQDGVSFLEHSFEEERRLGGVALTRLTCICASGRQASCGPPRLLLGTRVRGRQKPSEAPSPPAWVFLSSAPQTCSSVRVSCRGRVVGGRQGPE